MNKNTVKNEKDNDRYFITFKFCNFNYRIAGDQKYIKVCDLASLISINEDSQTGKNIIGTYIAWGLCLLSRPVHRPGIKRWRGKGNGAYRCYQGPGRE